MEKTLVIIKPDAVEAKCVGKIIDIFETHKFDIVQTEMMSLSDDMLNDHYSHLTDKPFFHKRSIYVDCRSRPCHS